MKPDVEELRKKYIENPPEGMTSKDFRRLSEYSGVCVPAVR